MADWNALYSNQGLVLKGNPALDELRNDIKLQDKQRVAENTNYTAQLAKLNFGGAKDADHPYLQQKFNDTMSVFKDLRNTNDPKLRSELGLKLQQAQNSLLYDIEHSKNANKQYMETAHLPLNPNANLADGAMSRISKLGQKSSFDPDYDTEYQTVTTNLFAPKSVDWNTETGKLFKNIVDKETKTEIVKDPQTGMLVNKRVVKENLDPHSFMTGIASMLKDPNKFKVAKRDFGGNDVDETAHNILNTFYPVYSKKLKEDITTGNPFETPQQRDARTLGREKELALWKQRNGIGNASNQLTPAQITVNNMKSGSPDAIDHFIKLAPKKQYGNAQPKFETDPLTGEHIFVFPAQIVPDPKAIQDNKKLRAEYKPKKDGIFGLTGKEIPFEKSKMAAELKPEFKEKKPAATYRLDPNDAEGYFGQAAQIANEQNIKLPQLNQILGNKGHGIIAPVADAPKKKTVKLKIPDAKLY